MWPIHGSLAARFLHLQIVGGPARIVVLETLCSIDSREPCPSQPRQERKRPD